MGYHTSAARATCVGCGGNLEIRAEFCRCTGARFWRSCHQSRVNERSESNRRHQASLSTFEVQGAAGRAVAIARCSVRRHRASCSSLDLSKTSSASVARTGPKKSHSEIISLSALPSFDSALREGIGAIYMAIKAHKNFQVFRQKKLNHCSLLCSPFNKDTNRQEFFKSH